MAHPPWESYVSHLCVEEWALDPHSLIKVMGDIEALVGSNDVSDATVATVLRKAGVPGSEAEAVAPRICHAIGAANGRPEAPPPPSM